MYGKNIIVGRLGRDPEMRVTPGGKEFTKFSVAVDAGYGDRKHTQWYNVTVWGNSAPACAEYLTKGSIVTVDGELQADPATGGPRIWTGSDGLPRASFEITARDVKFVQTNRRDADTAGQGQAAAPQNYDNVPF